MRKRIEMLACRRRSALVGALVLLSYLAGFQCKAYGATTIEPNYSRIEEGLYLGGLVPEPPPGTRAVLNLSRRADSYKCEIHRWEPIPDSEPAPTIDWLRQMVQFVDTQRRASVPTYVHCFAGLSRGGMVTTAYLMFENKWTLDETLRFIRSKRNGVEPNPAFMKLLAQWEGELKRTR